MISYKTSKSVNMLALFIARDIAYTCPTVEECWKEVDRLPEETKNLIHEMGTFEEVKER